MTEYSAPSKTLSESEVLRRIAQWESGRALFIQLLRENPTTRKFQDARTLENLGFGPAPATQHHLETHSPKSEFKQFSIMSLGKNLPLTLMK